MEHRRILHRHKAAVEQHVTLIRLLGVDQVRGEKPRQKCLSQGKGSEEFITFVQGDFPEEADPKLTHARLQQIKNLGNFDTEGDEEITVNNVQEMVVHNKEERKQEDDPGIEQKEIIESYTKSMVVQEE